MERYRWISIIRPERWVWLLFGVSALIVMVTSWIYYVAGTDEVAVEATFLFQNVMICLYAFIGAFILHHRLRNYIGWLFFGIAFIFSLSGFFKEYSILGLVLLPGRLPGLNMAAWLQIWLNSLTFPLGFILLNLFFPDGRLVSKGWRWLVLLTVLSQAIMVAQVALQPGRITLSRWDSSVVLPIQNPTGHFQLHQSFNNLEPLGWSAGLIYLVLSAFSILQRYRKGSGTVRQQIKWLAYFWGIALTLLVGVLLILILPVNFPESLSEVIFSLTLIGMLVANPLVVAAAIFRYRLYDIDILIKRSVVYGLLSSTLALIYYASVLLFQQIFQTQSELVIVLSTLSIAALFTPLRRRIQGLIDRQFYRRKYDAEKTVAAFVASLREQMDLDRVEGSLLSVVDETIQPETIWLWVAEVGVRDNAD